MTTEKSTTALEPMPAGWYGLRLDAAFSQLDEVRVWIRQWAKGVLVEALEGHIDLIASLDSGAGFCQVGDGRVLVIEKLPDGSAVCMGTHIDARADGPGEAFTQAAALGLVRNASMMVRYCTPLPPGELPDPIKPMTTH